MAFGFCGGDLGNRKPKVTPYLLDDQGKSLLQRLLVFPIRQFPIKKSLQFFYIGFKGAVQKFRAFLVNLARLNLFRIEFLRPIFQAK